MIVSITRSSKRTRIPEVQNKVETNLGVYYAASAEHEVREPPDTPPQKFAHNFAAIS